MGRDFKTPAEAAEILAVDVGTVRRWIREGIMKAGKRPGQVKGRLRIPDEEVERHKRVLTGREG